MLYWIQSQIFCCLGCVGEVMGYVSITSGVLFNETKRNNYAVLQKPSECPQAPS